MHFIYGTATAVSIYFALIYVPKIMKWWRKLDDDDRYYLGVMLNGVGALCVISGIPILFAYIIYRFAVYGERPPGC